MHKCSWSSTKACEKCSEKSSSFSTTSQKTKGLNRKSCSILRFKEKEGKAEWISINLQSICSVSNFLWELSGIYSIISLPLWVQPFNPLKHHCSLALLAFSDEDPTTEVLTEFFLKGNIFKLKDILGSKKNEKHLICLLRSTFEYTQAGIPQRTSLYYSDIWGYLGPLPLQEKHR